MTSNEFFAELGTLRTKWILTGAYDFKHLLRTEKTNFCPITAVANKKAKRHKFTNWMVRDAGAYLGLNVATVLNIVKAADVDSLYKRRLRNKLLKVTGVEGNN